MKPEIRSKFIQLACSVGVTHDYQHEALFSEVQDEIYNKARGIGLSFAFSLRMVLRAAMPQVWDKPQRETIVISAGDDQAKHLLKDYVIDGFWEKLKHNFKVYRTDDANDRLSLSNGFIIYSFALNPYAVRSYHGDVYGDEIAHWMPHKAQKMTAAISGLLTGGGKRRYWSTPNGEQGEFFDIWSKSPLFKKYTLRHEVCPRLEYKEFIERERIECQARGLMEVFAQEYECDFIAETGRAIPEEAIEQCCEGWESEFRQGNVLYPTTNNLYMGIDFAKQVDATWIVVLEQLTETTFRVYYTKKFEKADYKGEQLPYIRNLVSQLGNLITCQYDMTALGNVLAEDLTERVFTGVTFSNPVKDRLFTKVKYSLIDNQIQLPKNEEMITQIRKMRKLVTPSGMVSYQGKHDDAFWALALALDGAKGSVSAPLEIKSEPSQNQEQITDFFKYEEPKRRLI